MPIGFRAATVAAPASPDPGTGPSSMTSSAELLGSDTATAQERPPIVTARRRRRGWLVVLATTLVGVVLLTAAAVLFAALRPTTYSADSLVLVEAEAELDGAVPIAAVWAQVATSDTVMTPVAADLGQDVGQLRDATTVSSSETAPLITITATTTDRETSAASANAVADALLARAAEDPIDGFTLRQATEALPPGAADVDYERYIVVGAAVVGALLGLATGRRLLQGRRG